MATRVWTNVAGDDWAASPLNWLPTFAPTSTDDAVFSTPGIPTYSVTITSPVTVNSVAMGALGATILLDSGLTTNILTVTAGSFQLDGAGTVHGGILQATALGSFAWDGGTLDGVTYRGTLDMSATVANVTIINGITLTGAGGSGNGTVNLVGTTNSYLKFAFAQTVDDATINIGADDGQNGFTTAHFWGTGTSLTLGSDLTINHTLGNADLANTVPTTGSIVNDGTINASASGGFFTVEGAYFTNDSGGTINVTNHDTIYLNAATAINAGTLAIGQYGTAYIDAATGWANNGAITLASGGSLHIDGIFSQPLSGSITDQGTVTLDSTAQLHLAGTISGGTVVDSGATTFFDGATLSNVTYDGAIDLSTAESDLVITNGLTVQGAGTIADTGYDSLLNLLGTQTLDNALIEIGNAAVNNDSTLEATGTSGTIVTLGAGLTIEQTGRYATITGDGYSTIVNHGIIDASVSGGAFTIDPAATFTNYGTITVSHGDFLELHAASLNGSGGVYIDGSSTLELGGLVSQGIHFTGSSGGTLTFDAPLNYGGSIFNFDVGDTINLENIDATDATILGSILSVTYNDPNDSANDPHTLNIDLGGGSYTGDSVVTVGGAQSIAISLTANQSPPAPSFTVTDASPLASIPGSLGYEFGLLGNASGTLVLGLPNQNFSSPPVSLNGGTALTIDTNGYSDTISSVFSGSGGLAIDGAGILDFDFGLGFRDTHTGGTTIEGGATLVGSVLPSSGGVDIDNGTVDVHSGNLHTGTDFTIGGTGHLEIDVNQVSAVGTLTLGLGATIKIDHTNAILTAADLTDVNGSYGWDAGTNQEFDVTNDGTNTLVTVGTLQITQTPILTTSTVSLDGDTGTDGELASAITYAQTHFDPVTFTPNFTGPIVLHDHLPVINSDLVIDGTGGSVTIDGSGTNNYLIDVATGHTLTFTDISEVDGYLDYSGNPHPGANSYVVFNTTSGTTHFDGGTHEYLTLEKDGAGTLNINSDSYIHGDVEVNAGTLFVSYDANLYGDVHVTAGTLFVSYGSDIEGDLLISGGTVEAVGGEQFFGTGSLFGNITIENGATLQLDPEDDDPSDYATAVATNIVFGTGGTVHFLTNSSTPNGEYVYAYGSISGDGSILVDGGGTLYLDDDLSAFTGTLHIGAGTIVDASDATLPGSLQVDGGGTLYLDDDLSAFTGTLHIGAGTIVDASDATLPGSLQVDGGGTLYLGEDLGALTGTLQIGAGTIVDASDATLSGSLQVDGGGTLNLHDDLSAFAGTLHIGASTIVDASHATLPGSLQVDLQASGAELVIDGSALETPGGYTANAHLTLTSFANGARIELTNPGGTVTGATASVSSDGTQIIVDLHDSTVQGFPDDFITIDGSFGLFSGGVSVQGDQYGNVVIVSNSTAPQHISIANAAALAGGTSTTPLAIALGGNLSTEVNLPGGVPLDLSFVQFNTNGSTTPVVLFDVVGNANVTLPGLLPSNGKPLEFAATSGNNSIVGGAAAVEIFGGTDVNGQDTIKAGSGGGSLVGGAGTATIDAGGGDGTDWGVGHGATVWGALGGGALLGGGNYSMLVSRGNSTATTSMTASTNTSALHQFFQGDTVGGSTATDNISLSHTAGVEDIVVAGSGITNVQTFNSNDAIMGGSGHMTIGGGTTTENLIYIGSSSTSEATSIAGSADATVYALGGGGNDILSASFGGNSTLIGGTGHDTFFAAAGNGLMFSQGASGAHDAFQFADQATVLGAMAGSFIVDGFNAANDTLQITLAHPSDATAILASQQIVILTASDTSYAPLIGLSALQITLFDHEKIDIVGMTTITAANLVS